MQQLLQMDIDTCTHKDMHLRQELGSQRQSAHLVVDIQLRGHQGEAEGIHCGGQALQPPAVPTLVLCGHKKGRVWCVPQ